MLVPAATPSGVAPHVVEIPMPEDIHERYLVVQDVVTQEVITTIEILSLANKLTAEGRDAYTAKRQMVFGSQSNLVEIDLLRAAPPLPPFLVSGSAYRILISPAVQRPHAIAYTSGVRDAILTIAIPLRPGEREPTLPLNDLLHALYDRAGYDLVIDYSRPPEPPLSAADREWIRQHLALSQEGQQTG